MTSRVIRALISEDLSPPPASDARDAFRHYRRIAQTGGITAEPLSHEPAAGLCLHYFCGHFLADNRARDPIALMDVHRHFTALHPLAAGDERWALKPFARELQTYLGIVGAPYQPIADRLGVGSFAGVTVALTFDRARFAENVARFTRPGLRADLRKDFETPRNEQAR
jgi:hypothetical protein